MRTNYRFRIESRIVAYERLVTDSMSTSDDGYIALDAPLSNYFICEVSKQWDKRVHMLEINAFFLKQWVFWKKMFLKTKKTMFLTRLNT